MLKEVAGFIHDFGVTENYALFFCVSVWRLSAVQNVPEWAVSSMHEEYWKEHGLDDVVHFVVQISTAQNTRRFLYFRFVCSRLVHNSTRNITRVLSSGPLPKLTTMGSIFPHALSIRLYGIKSTEMKTSSCTCIALICKHTRIALTSEYAFIALTLKHIGPETPSGLRYTSYSHNGEKVLLCVHRSA